MKTKHKVEVREVTLAELIFFKAKVNDCRNFPRTYSRNSELEQESHATWKQATWKRFSTHRQTASRLWLKILVSVQETETLDNNNILFNNLEENTGS